jgi:branched-chain amino acid transport system ATP-binding protein
MTPLLEIDGLEVAYGKAQVVHGVSLRVGKGEFVTLLGRNGAGKSTTLHAASGLIGKLAGSVRFDGRDITHASPRDIVRERRRQTASRLSGGQQQILAVAQGMIAQPRLLILDEPSGGLAPLVVDRILDVARALTADGVAVLLVEQLVEKALAHADRCYLMEAGKMVHEAEASTVLGSEMLHRAFLGGH